MMNTIAEQILEAAKPLSEPLALEALNFIEYLRFRSERDDSRDWLLVQ